MHSPLTPCSAPDRAHARGSDPADARSCAPQAAPAARRGVRAVLRRLATAALAAAALGGVLATAGCASVEPQVYASQKPALDLKQYFDGRLIGHGLFMDRGGQVQRRFVVTINASWNGEVGTLDEDFVWSDGVKEKRVWTLKPVPGQPGRWTGTAADVKGEASGVVSGNALNWRYTFMLKTAEGKRYDIAFDDWMFLIDEKTMLNRAVMSFWGFRVGEVLISFTRT